VTITVYDSIQAIQQARQLDQFSHTSCAIGMFDGVHLGHQAVLQSAVAMAQLLGTTPAVFSFLNHPQSLLNKDTVLSGGMLLSSPQERLTLFARHGIALALLLPFDASLQQLPADHFVKQLLVDCLGVKSVSIGEDHHFGKQRKGNSQLLNTLGQQWGFSTHVVPPVNYPTPTTAVVGPPQVISSTLIRQALAQGDCKTATLCLGHPYTLQGIVVNGRGRGTNTLNTPTANIALPPERLLPANGVYAVWANLASKNDDTIGQPTLWPAVANLGVSPTFGDVTQPTLEVHLLDYHGHSLYEQVITVQLVAYLRNEMRFKSATALQAQIKQDCQQAKLVLLENGPIKSLSFF
jgi:riboflavin kinase / FMN adenylyltransferase